MTSDEKAELLASPEYEAAFNKVMSGTEVGALTEEERALIVRARELTGTQPPGFPMPSGHDRTRSEDA